MAQELGLTTLQLGVVISSLVFAAAFGALIAGRISDAIGRRRTIILLSLLFFAGALLVVFSPSGPPENSMVLVSEYLWQDESCWGWQSVVHRLWCRFT